MVRVLESSTDIIGYVNGIDVISASCVDRDGMWKVHSMSSPYNYVNLKVVEDILNTQLRVVKRVRELQCGNS